MRIKINRPFLTLCIALFAHMKTHCSIEFVQKITLINGKILIILADNYDDTSSDLRATNYFKLLQEIQNIAKTHREKSVLFTYEDPTVYDLGRDVHEKLIENKAHFLNLDTKTSFLGFVNLTGPKAASSLLKFEKPPQFSFFGGELTRAIALSNHRDFPENLSIKSNDPRQGHFLLLNQFLKTHQQRMVLNDFFGFSPLLKIHRHHYNEDISLPGTISMRLKKLFAKLAQRVELLKGLFASTISKKYHQKVDDFSYMLRLNTVLSTNTDDKIDLLFDAIYTYRNAFDYFAEAPVIDTIISSTKNYAEDIQITILGAERAQKVNKELSRMGIVFNEETFDNYHQAFSSMFHHF